MNVKTALQFIDRRLDDLFDALDQEYANGDISEADLEKALTIYGLTELWEDWWESNRANTET